MVAHTVKNPPTMQETGARSLSLEDPLEKGMAPNSVLWPREFHGLNRPWGLKESDTTERISQTDSLISDV